MASVTPFAELVRRARLGDDVAASDLVRKYEQELRIVARRRLTDARLRRTLETMDIFQSTFRNFLFRLQAGQFDLETPAQFMGLLTTMIRNKITDHERKIDAMANGGGRTLLNVEDIEVADDTESPLDRAARNELLELLRRELRSDELRVFELRRSGLPWVEVAEAVGDSIDSARKRLDNALNRFAMKVGLDELTDNIGP